jgi:hypothetical protein
MKTTELLRYNWKPSIVRLCLAALEDAGPVSKRAWAVRSGVPDNHLLPAVREAERLGAVAVEHGPEGMRLLVQPASFWRERELHGPEAWAGAWTRAEQIRLGPEAPGLAEALAVTTAREADRNPVGLPESGATGIRSGHVHVQRHGSEHPLNMEHGNGTGIRSKRERKAARGDAVRALELLKDHLWPLLTEQFRQHWQRRVDEDAGLVEYAVEEALLNRRGDRPTNLPAYANRIYLANVQARAVLKR